MNPMIKGMTGLAGLAFVLAVASFVISAPILGTNAEAFSRACSNLALLAIATSIIQKSAGGS